MSSPAPRVPPSSPELAPARAASSRTPVDTPQPLVNVTPVDTNWLAVHNNRHVDLRELRTVMEQCPSVSREQAIQALQTKGNVIDAILALTPNEPPFRTSMQVLETFEQTPEGRARYEAQIKKIHDELVGTSNPTEDRFIREALGNVVSGTSTSALAAAGNHVHAMTLGVHAPEKIAIMERLAPAAEPGFDVIIGWNPLVEEIVAAECYGVKGYTLLAMKPHGKVFKPEHLELCRGKRVLVCGSYFSAGELHRLAQVTRQMRVETYDDEFGVLCDAFCAHVPSKGPFPDAAFTRFHVDTDRFPRAKRLIRRALLPKPYMDDDEDEAFYRGLTHHAFADGITHEEAVVNWLRGEWSITEDELIKDGVTIAMEHDRVAADIVKGAVKVEKKGNFSDHGNVLNIQAVVSGSALVMPVAKELMGDVGVVIRYNLAQDSTSVTFYTETGADLSWVEVMPWNGGGKPNCKGTTLEGLIPIATLLEWLSAPVPSPSQSQKA